MKENSGQQIKVFNRTINSNTVIAILPYSPPGDLDREIYENLNATLILRRRPHRHPARRSVATLSEDLRFRLVECPFPIAINPAYTPAVEEKDGRTFLVFRRRGEKIRIAVATSPEALREALAAPQREYTSTPRHAAMPVQPSVAPR
jgi:hypothetical protein